MTTPKDSAGCSNATVCSSAKWSQTLEQQWFQVALKTYFWAGFLFAAVFAVSLVCLAATKYYYDQAVLRHNAMDRDFRSYSSELRDARKTLQEVGKVWYAVEQIRKDIEAKMEKLYEDNLQTYNLTNKPDFLIENKEIEKYLPKYLSIDEIKNEIQSLCLDNSGKSIGLAIKYLKNKGFNVRSEDVKSAIN